MASIWQHTLATRDLLNLKMESDVAPCPYCNVDMTSLNYVGTEIRSGNGWISDFRGCHCKVCGWWLLKLYRFAKRGSQAMEDDEDADFTHAMYYSHAVLRELDVTDVNAEIDTVRSYLLAKYESRFDVHPRVFEETVAAVFKDKGWDTQVTDYGNDGGIDVLVRGDTQIGIQVKRYRGRIGVEQIRSFSGALLAENITRGIFVTTSDFTRGAVKHPSMVAKSQKIELMDANKFFQELRLAQRLAYVSFEELLREQGIFAADFSNIDKDPIFTKHFKSQMAASVIQIGYWR